MLGLLALAACGSGPPREDEPAQQAPPPESAAPEEPPVTTMDSEDIELELWGELEERFPPADGYEVGVKCDDIETDRFNCEYWADEPGGETDMDCNPATEICDENGESTTHDNFGTEEVTIDQDGELHLKYGLPIGPGGSE